LCEAITDPASGGWYEDVDNGDEIGDICNGDVVKFGKYVIQKEWSNKSNACVVK
jgi:hypothetical protein